MELPIELDTDFGGGEEEDLSPAWLEAARFNVNDDPALRATRLKKFRESLADHKIHLRSGMTSTTTNQVGNDKYNDQ